MQRTIFAPDYDPDDFTLAELLAARASLNETLSLRDEPNHADVTIRAHLWERIRDALDANLVAWQGEEDSVRSEHAELIDELEQLDFYIAAHGPQRED